MHKSGSRLLKVLNIRGKTWVQPMETIWATLCTKTAIFPHGDTISVSMVITSRVMLSSYTNCTQVFRQVVHKITPVNTQFSAVYTGPITTITTYISI